MCPPFHASVTSEVAYMVTALGPDRHPKSPDTILGPASQPIRSQDDVPTQFVDLPASQSFARMVGE